VDEPVVHRIVDDVLECGGVLLLGLDRLRPEATAEDVVPAAVALVEGAGVGAVQVAHAVGEVGSRRFEDEVVVVAHQAADVSAPAVAALDSPQDVEEDHAILAVEHDRRIVVPGCPDVVVRSGGEVTAGASHAPTVTAVGPIVATAAAFVTGPEPPSYVPGTRLAARGQCPGGRGS
jgi:hypothetical protein